MYDLLFQNRFALWDLATAFVFGIAAGGVIDLVRTRRGK